MTALWVILGLAGGALFLAIGIFNRLVGLRNQFKNSFSQIDVQLKRRHDLIPNLVETAKGYMAHERQTLEAVISARNSAVRATQAMGGHVGDPAAMKELMQAEGALSGVLGRLFAVAESYPDLKANENMKQLMEELTATENRIAFSRQAFNDSVMTYNTARETFPNNLIAGSFGFMTATPYAVEAAGDRENVKVSFSSP